MIRAATGEARAARGCGHCSGARPSSSRETVSCARPLAASRSSWVSPAASRSARSRRPARRGSARHAGATPPRWAAACAVARSAARRQRRRLIRTAGRWPLAIQPLMVQRETPACSAAWATVSSPAGAICAGRVWAPWAGLRPAPVRARRESKGARPGGSGGVGDGRRRGARCGRDRRLPAYIPLGSCQVPAAQPSGAGASAARPASLGSTATVVASAAAGGTTTSTYSQQLLERNRLNAHDAASCGSGTRSEDAAVGRLRRFCHGRGDGPPPLRLFRRSAPGLLLRPQCGQPLPLAGRRCLPQPEV